MGVDQLLTDAAADPNLKGGKFAQRLHRALRPAFLKGTDDGVGENDDEDDCGVIAMPHGKGDQRRDKEQVDERTGELCAKHRPQGATPRLRQFVGTVLHEATCRFFC